jgi:hypothetical protein
MTGDTYEVLCWDALMCNVIHTTSGSGIQKFMLGIDKHREQGNLISFL